MLRGLLPLIAGLVLPMLPAGAQEDPGKLVYRKANCVGCHKWHGGGGGGYGGAALSLRTTELDAVQIEEVVRCGRPGTAMPIHDRNAYQSQPCFGGLALDDLGDSAPSRAARLLRDDEVTAVVAYVVHNLKGKTEITKADCVAFWGAASRECQAMN